MTYAELEQWAERNGMRASARAFPSMRKAVAELVLDEGANGEEHMTFWRPSLASAKRALCRAVEKLRAAE